MEDLTNTFYAQTFFVEGNVFSMCYGMHEMMRTTLQVIPGRLAADQSHALLSPAP